MKPAPVSVIIPSYNAGRFVTHAVHSVLLQTRVPAEVLVVDDGSVDDTRDRLAQYGNRIRYLYQENQGVSAARNLGLGSATQEFVAFLDADDVWHPLKIAIQLQVFQRHPELVLLGTSCFDWPAATFPVADPQRLPPPTFIPWEWLVVRNYLITSSVVARREGLQKAGLFDCGMQGPEDRDLWLRVAESSPIATLHLPLVGYRQVLGSVSKQAASCQAGMLRILRKLDTREAWGSRWRLRHKAYSYVYHACACIWSEAGCHGRAFSNSLQALARYPAPYGAWETEVSLERLRRLAVNLLRLLRLKPTQRIGQPPLSTGFLDALAALTASRGEPARTTDAVSSNA